MRRNRILLLAATIVAIMVSSFVLTTALSSPVVLLASGEESGLHATWDQLLQKHVNNGKVNYKGFAADASLLDSYLDKLNKTDITAFSRAQKLAFWINAYNAFTVKLILNHYPIAGIRKISRPWERREWNAAGETLSLDNIEHVKLRKELKEPRIHFAIVCASIGCPDLHSRAITPDSMENQLDAAARRFFASRKHFHTVEKGTRLIIFISKIFKWFGDDFGKIKGKKSPLSQRTSPLRKKKIQKATSFKLKYLSYNWNLNE